MESRQIRRCIEIGLENDEFLHLIVVVCAIRKTGNEFFFFCWRGSLFLTSNYLINWISLVLYYSFSFSMIQSWDSISFLSSQIHNSTEFSPLSFFSFYILFLIFFVLMLELITNSRSLFYFVYII